MSSQIKNFIWIRHAEKLYNNGRAVGKGKQHDPGIIDNLKTRNILYGLIDKLIKQLGVPEKIMTSPFLRTRQTTEIIIAYITQKYGWSPEVEYSEDISEYLGFCKNKNEKADLEEETLCHMNQPLLIKEDITTLDTRVEKHILNIHKNERNIWIVTHGIIMSKIFKFYNNFEPNRPEPLDYMALIKNKLSANFQQ